MSDQSEQILELKKELAMTRAAAVTMLVGMAQGIANSEEGLEDLAKGFDDAAEGADPILAELAKAVAAALRR